MKESSERSKKDKREVRERSKRATREHSDEDENTDVKRPATSKHTRLSLEVNTLVKPRKRVIWKVSLETVKQSGLGSIKSYGNIERVTVDIESQNLMGHKACQYLPTRSRHSTTHYHYFLYGRSWPWTTSIMPDFAADSVRIRKDVPQSSEDRGGRGHVACWRK